MIGPSPSWRATKAAKHSPESVRRRANFLDLDNRPNRFKFSLGIDQVPLPAHPPDDVPALEAIATIDVDEPAPGLDLAASGAWPRDTPFLAVGTARLSLYAFQP